MGNKDNSASADNLHEVYGMLVVDTGFGFGTGVGGAYEGEDPAHIIQEHKNYYMKNPEEMLEFRDPNNPPTVILVPVKNGKISKESAAELLDACAEQISKILEMTDDTEEMMHDAAGEPIPCLVCEAESILQDLNSLVEEYLPKDDEDDDIGAE